MARSALPQEEPVLAIGAIALVGAAALVWIASAPRYRHDQCAGPEGDASWLLSRQPPCSRSRRVLKSAQFPTHGWLTEGIWRHPLRSRPASCRRDQRRRFPADPFRRRDAFGPRVLAVLAMLGGFTALFGALVMLTQPAVKTSSAWSTVAQMGFMMLQCGLHCSRWRCSTSSPLALQGACVLASGGGRRAGGGHSPARTRRRPQWASGRSPS